MAGPARTDYPPFLFERWEWEIVVAAAVVGGLYLFGTTGSTVGGFIGFVTTFFVAFVLTFLADHVWRRYRHSA